jgi:acyl-homoserine-lactone acylase
MSRMRRCSKLASRAGVLRGIILAGGMLASGVIATACAPQILPDGGAQHAGAETSSEILWDRYGIPHIYAASDEALFHASGWAQAHSHGDLLLELLGLARGRAAEYWGERFVESDVLVRTTGVPRRGQEWYAAQPPDMRAFLDAFAAGINAYAAAHPEAISAQYVQVLPVHAADVLAHVNRVLHFTFVVSPQQLAGVTRAFQQRGSNAWAVAPQRTASGHALLMANPHLPWSGAYTFYEMHVSSPGVHAYGATLIGMPLPTIAFNDSLGWTHTVNTIDAADVYQLELTHDGYLFDGEIRRFDEDQQTLRVRRDDGTYEERPLVVRSSVHGPVIAQQGARALALRVAGLDRPHVLTQYWEMMQARNLHDFEEALRRQQMPMFTVIYADVHGRIMHLFQGTVPRRASGDWTFWSGIVPGTTSQTLWTDLHDYADLPRVVDPPTGWLQNANDPPWTTTVPLVIDPAHFPPYMAPRGMGMRAQRSARLLLEAPRITFEELMLRREDTRMELADRIVDDVIAAARQHGGEAARSAADVLAAWDRSADAGSRGGVLFQAFIREAQRRALAQQRPLFAVPWNPQEPLSTPRGLGDPAGAAAALDAAAAFVQQRYGRLDVPWGDVHRIRFGGLDLPASGGPGVHGEFRVLAFEETGDGTATVFHGDTYIAVIEFARPVRARALLTYGNASQPGSPHRTDQLPIFARKELRPVWLSRSEVEANTTGRTVLPPR